MTKYKAGDEVTIRLDECDAFKLSAQVPMGFRVVPSQIISHTPKRDLLDEACEGLVGNMLSTDPKDLARVVYGLSKSLESIIQYLREKEAERG